MTTAAPEREVKLELRGGNREIFEARDPEILAEGPAGTGKTRSWLELMNILCHTYKGLRVLMLRKIQATMPASCIAELKQHVLHSGEGVYFYGGSKDEPAAFRYANGSIIAVAGLDNAEKVLSSFWDFIYVNEATELTLEEWETLTTRLRGSDTDHTPRAEDGTPFTFRRLCADCNPTYASHWLMERTDEGKTRLIHSRLQDNPAYYNADGTPTDIGADYISKLDRLTGTRYERFRLGKRVGVENACFPTFDRTMQIRPLEPGLQLTHILGEDYGAVHLCAAGVLAVDQYNRRWVREVWAGEDVRDDITKPSSMDLVVAQFKQKYKISRGRVDPNQAKLALLHGFNIAKGGNGGATGAPRLHRVESMEKLFYVYEGGRVPTDKQIQTLTMPRGPFTEPDSYGIYLVEGAPGIEELADEWDGYHYVFSNTPKGKHKDVFRENENRAAAIEYANEEWEEGALEQGDGRGPLVIKPQREPRPVASGGWAGAQPVQRRGGW